MYSNTCCCAISLWIGWDNDLGRGIGHAMFDVVLQGFHPCANDIFGTFNMKYKQEISLIVSSWVSIL